MILLEDPKEYINPPKGSEEAFWLEDREKGLYIFNREGENKTLLGVLIPQGLVAERSSKGKQPVVFGLGLGFSQQVKENSWQVFLKGDEDKEKVIFFYAKSWGKSIHLFSYCLTKRVFKFSTGIGWSREELGFPCSQGNFFPLAGSSLKDYQ